MSRTIYIDISDACIASNGVWIYAFAVFDDLVDNERVYLAVLLHAEASIDTISDLSWSAVSTIDPSVLNPFESYITKICTVSPLGVFTLIGRDPYTSLSSGIRYDPSDTPTKVVYQTGNGGWSNITISPDYNWMGSSQDDQLFYSTAMSGISQVWHVYFDITTNIIVFGYLEEPFKMVKPAGRWSVTVATMGQVQSITYGNEQLFACVRGTVNSAIVVLPLVNYLSPTPVPSKFYPAPAAFAGCYPAEYVLSGILGSSYYLACVTSSSSTIPSQIFTIADTESAIDAAPVTTVIDPNYTLRDTFIPIGKALNPFAWTRSRGLGLAGQYQGHWEGLPLAPSITVMPQNGGIANGSSSSSTSSSSLSAGAIVGIVVGVLVLLSAGFLVVKRRKRAEGNVAAGRQEFEMESGAAFSSESTANATTLMSPVAMPLPSALQITYQVPQQNYGGLDQSQLATHPRPKFVTSMVDNSRQLCNILGKG